jgi:hypothetical protein
MALTRGSIIGYNSDRMMFEFTMKARDERVVACQISSVAMDYMDGDAVLRPWSVKRSSFDSETPSRRSLAISLKLRVPCTLA